MSKIQLDKIDLALLAQLGNDGRKSFADIAADLGVSAGTIRNRIKRLEDNGVLKFIGLVNPNHLSLNSYGTVYIRVNPPSLIEQVIKELTALPELNFLASVAGEYHLHADVMCLDNDHFMRFMRDKIHQIEGIVDTKTVMVLQVHKYGMSDLGTLIDSA
ncbi:MAG: Lrp/AsnC family transcriptional regulator for asnA, asnC and gidA [Candidatus Promineifilaceae bacterium]|jgi:Lrp/AsnC family transcriptional regulator for asnA, asnC and gidA